MVMNTAKRVAERYIAATWGQASQYAERLRNAIEALHGRVGAWKMEDAGNAASFLTFSITTADGTPRQGKVEFRGEARGYQNIRTKWVRFEGAYYDNPKKLAAVIAGTADARPQWTPGGS